MSMCIGLRQRSDDEAEPASPEPASPEPASSEPASPEPASHEPASPGPSSPYFSCSPGDSDVLLQESAFGSFVSTPTSPFTRNLRSVSSRNISSHASSSSDSSSSGARQGSIKRLFKRSVSLIVKSRSDYELVSLDSSDNKPLNEIKDCLLHVYRTNTLPHLGLCRFHEKLAEFVFSGAGGGPVERWWRGEVVTAGTRVLSVTVASPKDGDRIQALLNAWHLLYTTTLPLLQALMSPLNNLDVRGDVLGAFRDSVLPYAGISTSLTTQPGLSKKQLWKLHQMLLILVRISPCRCCLRDDTTDVDDKSDTTSSQHSPFSNFPGATGYNASPVIDSGPLTSSAWDNHRINDILYKLHQRREDKPMAASPPQMEQLLHLHHGGGQDMEFLYLRNVSKLQRHEHLPSPGYWLTRNLTSFHTLEDLLRSAASRQTSL